MYLNVDRAASVMDSDGLDVLVATTPHNVLYAAGYWSLGQWTLRGTQVYAVISRDSLDRPWLVMPHGELDLVVEQELVDQTQRVSYGTFFCRGREWGELSPKERHLAELLKEPKGEVSSALEGLLEVIRSIGASDARVALDERGLAYGTFEQVCAEIPRADVRPGYRALQGIRMVKTEREISLLRMAAQVTERGVYACLAAARPGVTEREMVEIFHGVLAREGATPLLTVIAFGSRSAFPNALPSDAKLEPGDIIRFDVGCVYKGYASDIARMAVLGEPSAKVQSYYDAIRIGEDQALKAVRAGVKASEVFEVAVKAVADSGIPHYRRHHVGHGVGIEIYDPPLLAPTDHTVLEAGMVIDVETPYYEIGFAGLQVEDTVVVREHGYERLTVSSREIIPVPPWGR